MRYSIITSLGILFKRVTGIRDISLMKKNIHKQCGKLIYYKRYCADEIIQVMKEFGMKEGSVICIHAAMKEFYNYNGTAEELIEKIQNVITTEGTLIMPAFPKQPSITDTSYIFDATKEPTLAGHLAEVFRKSKNVKRSINVQHSVCAWGKEADWLLKDHSLCTNCWDEKSPWFRMTQLDALVFTIGLPNYYIGTFDHCVEGLLYKTHPYWAQFFNEKRTYKYLDTVGNIKEYTCIQGNIERRTREKNVIRHFTQDEYKKTKLSNLLIKVFHSQPCLDKMLELAKRGITIYYIPSPQKYKF